MPQVSQEFYCTNVSGDNLIFISTLLEYFAAAELYDYRELNVNSTSEILHKSLLKNKDIQYWILLSSFN